MKNVFKKAILVILAVGVLLFGYRGGAYALDTFSCSAGQIPKYNGTAWACADDGSAARVAAPRQTTRRPTPRARREPIGRTIPRSLARPRAEHDRRRTLRSNPARRHLDRPGNPVLPWDVRRDDRRHRSDLSAGQAGPAGRATTP